MEPQTVISLICSYGLSIGISLLLALKLGKMSMGNLTPEKVQETAADLLEREIIKLLDKSLAPLELGTGRLHSTVRKVLVKQGVVLDNPNLQVLKTIYNSLLSNEGLGPYYDLALQLL